MKEKFVLGACLLSIVMLTACTGNSAKSNAERDSIAFENQRLNEFLDIVAYSLDSINGQERYLYQDREGRIITNKEQIRNNLRLFKYTLDEQRKRIAELEEQLKNSDNLHSKKIQAVINSMQAQLDEKDAIIAQLEEELERKDANITTLKAHVEKLSTNVSTLSNQVEELNEKNQEKEENLQSANQEIASLSTGYVLMGTKKDLSATGVMSGGFLKKKKVNLSNADNAKFKKVDTRSCKRIEVPGENAKVLTPQPSSSYSIEGNTIIITSPEDFWGVSRYLVIQHK